jgi:aminopeptidase N
LANNPAILKLADYKKPDFQIPHIDLEFVIHSQERITVRSTMNVVSEGQTSSPLELQGTNQALRSVRIDGRELEVSEFTLTEKTLTIPAVLGACSLEVESDINPAQNTSLEGLYKSGEMLCTQCEAEGFRNIIFHPDRPDVMSTYTTRIEADKGAYPILLSNGNLVEEGDLENGRHFTKWEDPFKKPCYLFALVAGDLAEIVDSYKTMSGRTVDIRFYVDKGDEEKVTHAVDALKSSMKWDEEIYGLECDLDRYMVVSVNSFNFGAMENKGLNIFNSAYALADPKTATDADFELIAAVIAHEYFHNWTGNRVTCRDWFQLTLKEGLTVYRDQQFTGDHTSHVLKRIEDVRRLRNAQFPEDSGPNAHPIRPQEVMDIENFYTATVYEKGAEVIRMIATLIGDEAFRKGIDRYFDLFDGQAVTCDDFVRAMEGASGKDLAQFRRWYDQDGTPACAVATAFNDAEKQYSVTVTQRNPAKAGASREPLHIPFSVGLVGRDGTDVASRVLELTQASQTFVFDNVEEEPVPSLNRGFSAPVHVEYDYSDEDLAFLLSHDSDGFNRYEAGQRLGKKELRRLIDELRGGATPVAAESVLEAVGTLIDDANRDRTFFAEALLLPSLRELVEEMDVANYDVAHAARTLLRKAIALCHDQKLADLYDSLDDGSVYASDSASIGKRSLKNTILSYLVASEEGVHIERAYTQFQAADNMTDSAAALRFLCSTDSARRSQALQSFYDTWKSDKLVMDKWISAQSTADRDTVLEEVMALEEDPVYDAKNPNRIRSLLGGFMGNAVHFHHASGRGYTFITDRVIDFDSFNPKVASGMAKGFKTFPRLDEARKALMRIELQRIIDAEPSEMVYEIVSNTLKSG